MGGWTGHCGGLRLFGAASLFSCPHLPPLATTLHVYIKATPARQSNSVRLHIFPGMVAEFQTTTFFQAEIQPPL